MVFNERIDPATFTAADVQVSGPQSPGVALIEQVSPTVYRLVFTAPLSAEGTYVLVIGSNIRSLESGIRIDQDRDGRVSSDECSAYARRVLKDIRIGLDEKVSPLISFIFSAAAVS